MDELDVLLKSSGFIGNAFNCVVVVMDADSAGDDIDPQGKRRFAEPGRPAIYIEKQE